MPGLLLGAAVS